MKAYKQMATEFKVGGMFRGDQEHWSERETVSPLFEINGEILEVKPNGLCIDDGKGDEVFVAFSTIAKHRAALRRDMDEDLRQSFGTSVFFNRSTPSDLTNES